MTKIAKKVLWIATAWAGILFGSDEGALELSQDVDRFAQIATQTKRNVDYMPYIISVLKGDELEKLGISTLGEALTLVPGVDMATDTIDYQTPIFRGSNPFAYGQSKLLIDGICVNDTFFDGYSPYLDMPIEIIKRIEVVRGPGSMADGINAYAGSIHVVTYAEDFEGLDKKERLFFKGGSHNALGGGFVQDVKEGELKLHADFYYHKDDKKLFVGNDSLKQGVYNFFAPFPDIDNSMLSRSGQAPLMLQNGSLGLKLDYKNLTLEGRILRYEHGSAYGINAMLPDENDHIELPRNYLQISYVADVAPNLKATFKAGYKDDTFHSEAMLAPAGMVFPKLSNPYGETVTFTEGFYGIHESKQLTVYLESFARYEGLRNHEIMVGFKILDEKTTGVVTTTTDRDTGSGLVDYSKSFPFFDEDARRKSTILSCQDIYDTSDKTTLIYGINFEDNSHIDPTFNPRVSVVYRYDEGNIFKAMASRSHRNPSWQELYTMNNSARLGNPDLEPEIVNAFETAYIKKFDMDESFGLNLFYLINENQIMRVYNPALKAYRYENFYNSDIYGFEAEYRGPIGLKGLFSASYSFVDGHDDEDNGLANAAKHLVKSSYTYALGKHLFVGAVAKYVGEKGRIANDEREKVDDYMTLDAAISYQNKKSGLTISAAVKNIFDADIVFPSEPRTYYDDYPQDGRWWIIRLVKEF